MAELPSLEGGWELRSFDLPGVAPLDLFVPKHPDALLDDEGVLERSRVHDAMPYWAWLWDSAPEMVAALAGESIGPGARVLEVGAGLGLVGLGVALVHGVSVTLTDYDPTALEVIPVQARLNGLDRVEAVHLDWRDPASGPSGPFDVIVGCDVIYEGGAHLPLLDLCERLLAPGGAAWFADPGRSRRKGFLARAEARGFRVEVAGDAKQGEGAVGEYALISLRAKG